MRRFCLRLFWLEWIASIQGHAGLSLNFCLQLVHTHCTRLIFFIDYRHNFSIAQEAQKATSGRIRSAKKVYLPIEYATGGRCDWVCFNCHNSHNQLSVFLSSCIAYRGLVCMSSASTRSKLPPVSAGGVRTAREGIF